MKKIFKANQRGMAECQEFIAAFCEDPKPSIIQDEIVSNIVRCSGASELGVDFAQNEDGTVTMVFTDDGKPFDPLSEISAPDLTKDVNSREVGGLGIFMVRKMSKSVKYERKGDLNILTVTI